MSADFTMYPPRYLKSGECYVSPMHRRSCVLLYPSLKLMPQWLPSQKGLFLDAPQRYSAIKGLHMIATPLAFLKPAKSFPK